MESTVRSVFFLDAAPDRCGAVFQVNYRLPSRPREGRALLQVMRKISENITTILVCQLRQIGDVLLSTPALRLLSERFPQAGIHLFTEAKCAPIVAHNPRLEHVWSVDKTLLTHLGKELAFYWQVARHGFDLVVDFQQLPRCRWVTAFSGASVRLSYPPPWYNKLLYTHWTAPKAGYAAMAKASILAPLGITWQGERPELYLLEDEWQRAREMLYALGLGGGDVLASVDATHRRSSRAWPPAYWGRLLALLGAQAPHMKFLLHYGPGEESVIAQVVAAAHAAGLDAKRVLVPQQVLGLREMAACVGASHIHVGNCSAPRHVAVALGTPSFTILGATSGSWTFPSPEHAHFALRDVRPIDCQPCNRNSCPLYGAPRCLVELEPEMVLPRLLEHLRRHAPMMNAS